MSQLQRHHDCGCGGTRSAAASSSQESNLEAQVRQLARQQSQLADLMARYMSEAGLERKERVANARSMAEGVNRIVGGVETGAGEFKDCCVIGRQNANGTVDWFCTGVLIHPGVVITAAHCAPLNPNVVALNALKISALSGAEIVQTRPVARHPLYASTSPLNDIAVLVLRTPSAQAPTKMATKAEINAAAKTTLVGFGRDDRNSTRGFGVKRKVTVDITGIRRRPADNLDALEHRFGFESDLEFVAGGSGFDSCNGDSGGPAYVYNAAGKLRVAGVTSRATDDAVTACGDGGIYTRVDVHHAFIKGVAAGFGISI